MRAKNGLKQGREVSRWLALKHARDLPTKRAVDEALEQLLALQQGLEKIR